MIIKLNICTLFFKCWLNKMSVHRTRQAQSCTLEAGLIHMVCSPTSRICWARISRSSLNCSCLWCFSCSLKARNSSFCFFFSLAVKLKWIIWIRNSLIIHNNSLLWKINCITVIWVKKICEQINVENYCVSYSEGNLNQ